jgi:hypothetical protein
MGANHLKDFDLINLKSLARDSKVYYGTLRNNIAGDYNSLSDQDRTRIYNALREGVEKAAAYLGFSYEGRPLVRSIPEKRKKS